MRKFILCIHGMVCFFLVHGQGDILEGKWKEYQGARVDTAKIRILFELSTIYADINLDSTFMLARRGLNMARQLHNKRLEVMGMLELGYAYASIGAGEQALEIGLNLLKDVENFKDGYITVLVYNFIGFVYAELEDFDKCLFYGYKIMQMPELTIDKKTLLFISMGDVYMRRGQVDSAWHYNNKAYEMIDKSNSQRMLVLVKNNFGNIFLGKKQPDMALIYYRQSLPYALQTNYTSIICESSMGISQVYEGQNQLDSARYYAHLSLSAAQQAQYTSYILRSSNHLADLYTRARLSDSAVKYYMLAKATRDSLFTQEKTSRIKALELQEAARQQDLAQAEQIARNERRVNIQYAIILIGIVTLLLMVLLLSRTFIVHHSWVRFLGVLSLLLVFEFINLYLHPFLDTVTGHSPIAMLLIMAVVASLLIPLHHRMEHWIIGKLVEKNKQIRLRTARRIVSDLSEPS